MKHPASQAAQSPSRAADNNDSDHFHEKEAQGQGLLWCGLADITLLYTRRRRRLVVNTNRSQSVVRFK